MNHQRYKSEFRIHPKAKLRLLLPFGHIHLPHIVSVHTTTTELSGRVIDVLVQEIFTPLRIGIPFSCHCPKRFITNKVINTTVSILFISLSVNLVLSVCYKTTYYITQFDELSLRYFISTIFFTISSFPAFNL